MPARVGTPVFAAIALLLALGVARPAPARPDPPAEAGVADNVKARLPLVTLSGADSKLGRGYHRVGNADAFNAIYMSHLGRDPAEFNAYHNPHGVPTVNFDECMVVAVFQGEGWNSAGVVVHSIEEDEHRVTLRFDDRAYQTAGPDGGARRVSAYGFFVLPRSDKLLVLEENVQNVIGQPPVWRERARIPAEGVW